jgi:hypothetical protein
MSTKAAVAGLIGEGYFQVAVKGEDIHLFRAIGGKPITLVLERMPNGGFWMRSTKYTFRSTTSFLDFTEQEDRVTRRFTAIVPFLMHLQRCEVWKHIENRQGYIEVNDKNPRLKKAPTIKDRLVKRVGELTDFSKG